MLLFGIVIFVDHCFTFAFLRICIRTCLLNMHIFLIILNLENISICKRFQACKERGKAGRGEGIHYYSYKQSFSLCGLKVMMFSNDCKFLFFGTACLLTCLFPWKRSLTFSLLFSMTYIYRIFI